MNDDSEGGRIVGTHQRGLRRIARSPTTRDEGSHQHRCARGDTALHIRRSHRTTHQGVSKLRESRSDQRADEPQRHRSHAAEPGGQLQPRPGGGTAAVRKAQVAPDANLSGYGHADRGTEDGPDDGAALRVRPARSATPCAVCSSRDGRRGERPRRGPLGDGWRGNDQLRGQEDEESGRSHGGNDHGPTRLPRRSTIVEPPPTASPSVPHRTSRVWLASAAFENVPIPAKVV